MADPDDTVTEAFGKIAKLAVLLGVKNIRELSGCWELQIDEHWWIAVNGHREPVKNSLGDDVPPFEAYIQFNDWPAGLISPRGGIIAAGSCANENTFIDALDRRIRALEAAQ
jgi:hypothetical protein